MMLDVNPGDKYGNLTVIREVKRDRLPSGQINRMMQCKCKCGSVKTYRLGHLNHGKSKSCGCLSKTRKGRSHTVYGKLLRSMLWRCKPGYVDHRCYYDKGIRVWDGWANDLDEFTKWCKENGYKKGLTIDRIDNSKGYFPDNCRFVTQRVNCNNRDITFRVKYRGKNRPLKLLLRELGNPNIYETVRRRILRGWDVYEAVHKPPGKNYSGRFKNGIGKN